MISALIYDVSYAMIYDVVTKQKRMITTIDIWYCTWYDVDYGIWHDRWYDIDMTYDMIYNIMCYNKKTCYDIRCTIFYSIWYAMICYDMLYHMLYDMLYHMLYHMLYLAYAIWYTMWYTLWYAMICCDTL